MAAIITTQVTMKNAKDPSVVVTPMSMPCICRTAMTQPAAASPSVPARAAVLAAAGLAVIP